MLHKVSKLRGVTVRGTDGELGEVTGLYLDDDRWAIRYLSVKTGTWLDGRSVLISPMAVERRWTIAELPVRLTREQLSNCPDVEIQEPLSRQHERRLLAHYGHPAYWEGGGLWGAFSDPGALIAALPLTPSPDSTPQLSEGDRRLRNTDDLRGFHLEASDGPIGHIDDFLIDEDSWGVRYLVIDTSNWVGGKSVAIPPKVLQHIDWTGRKVQVATTREVIKGAPPLESMDVPSVEDMAPFTII